MDKLHALLVYELVQYLGVMMDMFCDGEELSKSSDQEMKTLKQAGALLQLAGSSVPPIVELLVEKMTQWEREQEEAPAGSSKTT
jgi:hypothetical protein